MPDYLPRDCKCHRLQLCEFREGKCTGQLSAEPKPHVPSSVPYTSDGNCKQLHQQIKIQIIKHGRADKQEVSSMPSPRHRLTISLVNTGLSNYFDFAPETHCGPDHSSV